MCELKYLSSPFSVTYDSMQIENSSDWKNKHVSCPIDQLNACYRLKHNCLPKHRLSPALSTLMNFINALTDIELIDHYGGGQTRVHAEEGRGCMLVTSSGQSIDQGVSVNKHRSWSFKCHDISILQKPKNYVATYAVWKLDD